jgi:hypothetical protein
MSGISLKNRVQSDSTGTYPLLIKKPPPETFWAWFYYEQAV